MMSNAPREASRWGVLWQIDKLNPLSPSFLLAIFGLSALTGFGFDLPRYGVSTTVLLAVGLESLGQFVLYTAMVWPVHFFLRSGALAVASALAYLGSYCAKSWALSFVLVPDAWPDDFLSRLPGDLSYSALVWIGVSVVWVTRGQYNAEFSDVVAQRARLLRQRHSLENMASTINEQLRHQAKSALTPSLNALSKAMSRGEGKDSAEALSSEIQQLIEERIRPLSAEISQHRVNLDALDDGEPTPPDWRAASRIHINPSSDFRVAVAFLAVSPNVFFTVAQLSTYPVALAILGVSFTFWPIFQTLIRVWPEFKTVSFWGYLALTGVMSILAYIPTWLVFQVVLVNYPALTPIQGTAWGVYFLAVLVVGAWRAVQRSRRVQLDEIAELTREMGRELGLAQQTIWLIHRKWSYLLHGTLQALLTVARARLEGVSTVTPELRKTVLADISRAKKALKEPVTFATDARALLSEVRTTWEGLCEVHIDIASDVFERIDGVELATTSVSEIVKELVSNAYRHGGASVVWVVGRLDEHDDVVLNSSNNGAPFPETITAGVGFQMFNDLTTHWAIDSAANRFSATIATRAD